MRKILYLFAFISLGLLIISAINLGKQFTNTALPTIGELKGFEDNNTNDEYSQLVIRFKEEINTHTSSAEKNQSWYFWMSFLVTALIAASTLVSSIQAAKKEATDTNRTRKFLIVIAILTFSSTLVSFASTHFNELKTEEAKKAADLTTMRNQFYTDYEKAPADTKLSVITSYSRRLD